jgi:hypothetical protein
MSIVFYLDPQGGFTAGDTVTRVTSYAYPTSTHATKARSKPTLVAAEMVKQQNTQWRGEPKTVAEYDARNWARLTVITLDDGRIFPVCDNRALSWNIGSDFTISDENAGYPKTRAIIQAFRWHRPDQLTREIAQLRKDTFGQMFGHKAKKLLKLIEEELSK